MEKNVEEYKIFTNKQVLSLLAGAIFTTFSLTTIYNKFVFNDEEIKLNKSNIELNDKNINERLDKKTKRNEDSITDLAKEVEKLQESGSDSEE